MRLPDHERSYAVLIGIGTYRSDSLDDLPAVHNNLSGLVDVLTRPGFGGFAREHCIVLSDYDDPRQVYSTVRKYAGMARDTLLVYFAGHGCTDQRNELYLALSGTDPRVDLRVNAFAYDHLRELVMDSPATNRAVILDCCFAGRAIAGMSSADAALLGQIGIEGSYVLTATAAEAPALAPLGAQYTAFSGELIRLLTTGVSDANEFLTLGTIYQHMLRVMRERGLPVPHRRSTGTADRLALTRNPGQRLVGRMPPGSNGSVPGDVTGNDEAGPVALLRSSLARRTLAAAAITAAAAGALAVASPWRSREGAPGSSSSPSAAGTGTVGPSRSPGLPNYVVARELTGHTDVITSVVFSPDGNTLASGSGDSTVCLWDCATGQPMGKPLTGHSGSVVDVAFDFTGELLASTGDDGKIRLWDVATGRLTRIPIDTGDPAHAVAFSPADGVLASAGIGGSVKLWNPSTGELIRESEQSQSQVIRALAFSPTGVVLVSGDYAGEIMFWNPSSGKIIRRAVKGQDSMALDLAFSPDGELLASANFGKGTVCLWDPDTGRSVGEPIDAHAGEIRSVAFDPDSGLLASGGDDKLVRLWEPRTGRIVGQPLRGHASKVNSVSFSAHGSVLASASDEKIIIWRMTA
ncbi:caspase family protein [Catellatospora citrea]|uniref:caspase, EACC1-associated type n=1 Tax=Catellatospora citrea TaxID=53366 RepID=UPI003409869E